jgi:hypothetical protein
MPIAGMIQAFQYICALSRAQGPWRSVTRSERLSCITLWFSIVSIIVFNAKKNPYPFPTLRERGSERCESAGGLGRQDFGEDENTSTITAHLYTPARISFHDFVRASCIPHEARVIWDMSLLIVPSAERVVIRSGKHVQCLIESVNNEE